MSYQFGFLSLPANDADTLDVPVSSKRDKHPAERGASGGEDDKLPGGYRQKLLHEIVRRPGVDDELGGCSSVMASSTGHTSFASTYTLAMSQSFP
ncbi:hypothetical protein KC19_11G145600 [Ceratodon purpureus]|uniref:Uncharacterized protein n=1 Tax=Ceratodon purpureus TaxID=3225 RepID=A0A8T0GF27_CERPU|nr:hypothetical protein KC19_11G145600 [Ceratodon purpureus]